MQRFANISQPRRRRLLGAFSAITNLRVDLPFKLYALVLCLIIPGTSYNTLVQVFERGYGGHSSHLVAVVCRHTDDLRERCYTLQLVVDTQEDKWAWLKVGHSTTTKYTL